MRLYSLKQVQGGDGVADGGWCAGGADGGWWGGRRLVGRTATGGADGNWCGGRRMVLERA
ncbi:hypothetical protein [Paenibacillus herberti]|uniref:Uncharacterized protein n=1 Tax=Paenibacillus herberti TaxID=1619309 RepID=A0A229NVP5_9BACL|nr:hypothetical protein [Paenibacillus herberti]OXM13987.1 hypothetical protein CGZ75_13355 [Paenibacillus herberti]